MRRRRPLWTPARPGKLSDPRYKCSDYILKTFSPVGSFVRSHLQPEWEGFKYATMFKVKKKRKHSFRINVLNHNGDKIYFTQRRSNELVHTTIKRSGREKKLKITKNDAIIACGPIYVKTHSFILMCLLLLLLR